MEAEVKFERQPIDERLVARLERRADSYARSHGTFRAYLFCYAMSGYQDGFFCDKDRCEELTKGNDATRKLHSGVG